MSKLDYAEIILNPVLGARILWPAIYEYQQSKDGLPLPLAMLILPICLHKKSRQHIFGMNKKGGLISKAINKKSVNLDPTATGNDLAIGLQDRINQTFFLTLQSLDVAIAANLFELNQPEISLVPSYRVADTNLPRALEAEEGTPIDEQFKASSRLGAWFANSEIESIYSSLRVEL